MLFQEIYLRNSSWSSTENSFRSSFSPSRSCFRIFSEAPPETYLEVSAEFFKNCESLVPLGYFPGVPSGILQQVLPWASSEVPPYVACFSRNHYNRPSVISSTNSSEISFGSSSGNYFKIFSGDSSESLSGHSPRTFPRSSGTSGNFSRSAFCDFFSDQQKLPPKASPEFV